MRRVVFLLFLLACVAGAKDSAKTYESFRELFLAAPNGITDAKLSDMMLDYTDFVWPRMGVYPLEKLKSDPAYTQTIERLLTSSELSQRVLAYIVIASSNDHARVDRLWAVVHNHREGEAWAGTALIFLQDEHTEELFDFVVRCDEPEDPHLFALFLELDPVSRRACALKKITSEDPRVRRLAVGSLNETELIPESERAIREAIRSWPPEQRGYAIYMASEFGLADLRALLEPSLKLDLLRGVSLAALANSPTAEDQTYLESFIPENGEISRELLDALLGSTRVARVRRGLELIRTRTVARDFTSLPRQPILRSDELLSAVQETIAETPNRGLVSDLARTLAGRTDDQSVELLLGLLEDKDSTIRYWAADSLKGIRDPRLAARLPALLRDPTLRTSALITLAVQNQVDGLQDVFEPMLAKDTEREWRRVAIQYLAAFPKPAYREIFRTLLQDGEEPREAARGLGNLRDASSVDLIVQALAREKYDDHAIAYLEALGAIKGDQARLILESYRKSEVDKVRLLVEKILEDW